MDALQTDGPLRDLASDEKLLLPDRGGNTEDCRCYGYVVDTEHYRYYLPLHPFLATTGVSLHRYDLRQQQMAQPGKACIRRVIFADGSRMDYTTRRNISVHQEELPHHSVWGLPL